MPNDALPELDDAETIRSAYAERVKESFKVFAENLAMGQNEHNSRERFVRSLEMIRKARDLALAALHDVGIVEPAAPGAARAAHDGAGDDISAEAREMIEKALAGTTGQKRII